MNIESLLVQWLLKQEELSGVHVSMDVPPNRQELMVTVERTGGDETTHGFIDRPMLAIQCWAPSRLKASELAQTVKTILRRSPSIPQIKHCSIESTVNFPLDESTPRYQIVASLVTQSA